MQTFILLTRLQPEILRTPAAMNDAEKRVKERVDKACPDVKWLHNYVLGGPYDYLDIFEAEGIDSALKVAALVRTFGRSHSEIWHATEWDHYKTLIAELPAS